MKGGGGGNRGRGAGDSGRLSMRGAAETLGGGGTWGQMRACRSRGRRTGEKEECQERGDEGCRKQRENCGKSWRTEKE